MAAPTFSVVNFTLSTAAAGNTQDISAGSGFGTPDAVIFIVGGATADTNNVTADAQLSIGFTDGTNTDWSIGNFCRGGSAADSETARSQGHGACITQVDNTSQTLTQEAEFSFNSWITDGVRLDIDTAATSAYYGMAIFIKGGLDYAETFIHDDLGSGTPPQTSSKVLSGSGEPDLVFFAYGRSSAITQTNNTDANSSFGICHNTTGLPQKTIMWMDADAQTSSRGSTEINSGAVGGTGSQTTSSGDITVSSIDTDGSGFGRLNFSVSYDPNNTVIGGLALKFTDAINVALFNSTFTASSDIDENGPGFEPNFGLIWAGNGWTSHDHFLSSGGSIIANGFCAFDSDSGGSVSFNSRDNRNVMNANSRFESQLNFVAEGGGTGTLIRGPLPTFDSGGWTSTLTSQPASTFYGFGLAIGDAAAAAATPKGVLGGRLLYGPMRGPLG